MLIEGLEPLPAGTLETLRRASTASITAELFKLGIRHSFMTGVSPLDPAAILAAATSLIAAALLACYVPIRRATRIDPASALRAE